MTDRPFAPSLERLKRHGLRPTRQRLALVKILFDRGDRHVTADNLRDEAAAAGVRVSLATIYNTLNQFTAAGLLRWHWLGKWLGHWPRLRLRAWAG